MISTTVAAVVTRFAPSPTGQLHAGHAFSAIRAHDFARERGGRFLLRIEDIDPGRSRAVFVKGIEDDLRWLGLGWDGEVVHQSARFEAYRGALGALGSAGLLYPCFCTRADIAQAASAPHGPEGLFYPGTCRALDPAVRERRMESEPHAWRIAMDKAVEQTGRLHWHDEETGEVTADPLRFGDVVLARKDAPASYHLAVTVDDAWQRVTDVVRGADLFEATHIHRLLQALLGLPTPRYHHHPLLTDAGGERLAKRRGSESLANLRENGADPAALAEALRRGEMPAL
ncbi:tRNA glutamyl-Q(34) synthetase GluQRS [Sphingomonas sp. CGMCC 1.13654]|uniref:tRNA glutamyl-Q(34) synthetase GluQRS n=1 Tax=Sphingomonas chungangi TaxID=2683589 RepID=A0A838L904_9SPHN|nr:tRNA glutamyl-Q(34) synthetase GluQRS [Sphingomonas chungangi]MBA2935390.1 tRNA glutamyl-Q(34) synthetase GluQRS [Sphingomonas chungangi]MVW56896.1 tRNA glutamyl-Q(34) synthetase GluQRS [Sphingomonas chungangi]